MAFENKDRFFIVEIFNIVASPLEEVKRFSDALLEGHEVS
jgi:hypothetical protein